MSVAVERAIDALKRGRPVTVSAGGESLAVLAVEAAADAEIAAFGDADLLVTDKRAAVLGLANQREAAGMRAVRIAHAPWVDADAARAIADPVRDLATPLKGPFRTLPLGSLERAATAALALAKHAGLLPALFVTDGPAQGSDRVQADEVESYADPATLVEVSRAKLPLKAAETCEVVVFRARGGPEHLALLIGDPHARTPLVRLHSACLTGDVLGSLKCDCGDQLQAALAAIAASGGGVLLYLQQEGRGIGLAAKLRAYALQDQGFDTVDANLRLGFEIDERDFGLAAAMLRALGLPRIRLLTNNPAKIAALEAEGIAVEERVPIAVGGGHFNEGYLATKRDRTGHLL
jgi:GTP cyclohydrolase II